MVKSLLDKVNAKLNGQGGFFKSVGVLVGGTAFAQLISILTLPIITRLYAPTDFALFAIYTSLLMILTSVSSLRFEIAIPLPEDDKEAVGLLFLALIFNFIISVLIGLLIWLFHTEIILLLRQKEFSKLIWLVPLGVFSFGIYNTLQYWGTRKKSFTIIAKTRMVQSISGAIVQIFMGYLGFSALGLILGQIIKTSAGIKRLFLIFWYEANFLIKNINFQYLKKIFKKNDQFPKYSSFDALANTASIQLPIIIISILMPNGSVGYLTLAMQLLAIPMQFIGGAISQVYLSHVSEVKKNGDIAKYTRSVLENLYKYGFSILILIGLISPILVKYIFGNNWEKMGYLISWMIPWFIFQLAASPISMIMHVFNKQKQMLLLTIFGLFIKVGSLYSQYYIDSRYLLENYAISSAVFYFVCYLVFCNVAGFEKKDHIFLIKKSTLFIILSSGGAVLLFFTLKWLGL